MRRGHFEGDVYPRDDVDRVVARVRMPDETALSKTGLPGIASRLFGIAAPGQGNVVRRDLT